MLGAATRRRGRHDGVGWKPATQAASKHALSARLSGIASSLVPWRSGVDTSGTRRYSADDAREQEKKRENKADPAKPALPAI